MLLSDIVNNMHRPDINSRVITFLTTRGFYYDFDNDEYRLHNIAITLESEYKVVNRFTAEEKIFETAEELEDFVNDYLNKLYN
jgi:hypothetical protein